MFSGVLQIPLFGSSSGVGTFRTKPSGYDLKRKERLLEKKIRIAEYTGNPREMEMLQREKARLLRTLSRA
ncbi:MAG: hypothetical protein WCJ84_02710 [Candidatus Peregrinibacteria bacterium]